MNTVTQNDYSYLETINEIVQEERADDMDEEVMG